MPHRAAQIIDQVAALLVTNATWSTRVHKARARSVSEAEGESPAAFVFPGADDPASQFGSANMAVIDSLLSLTVTAVEEGDEEPELLAELFEKRRQIHITLMADIQLVLPTFVIEVRTMGAAAPQIADQGSRLVGAYETRWAVLYRQNFTDPN